MYKIIIISSLISTLHGEGIWVKYGWEIFDYVIDARSTALGSATIAYNTNSATSSIINPVHSRVTSRHISITHHSRFAGIVNSDLIGLQVKKDNRIVNINMIYEGISNIPDTRSMLLDWGNDGQFGTNDYGEGNGIIDEGERLNSDQLKYFNQHRLGFHASFSNQIMGMPYGLAIKLLSYSLDSHFAIGIGMDFGFIKIFRYSNIGFVIRNLPASGLIWDNGRIEGTVPSFSIGCFRNLNFLKSETIKLNALICLDGNLYNRHMDSPISHEDNSIDISMGIETIFKEKLMLRLGRNSLSHITGGLGMNWDNFLIDYAFSLSNADGTLGNNHLLSIGISIDWIASRFNDKYNYLF